MSRETGSLPEVEFDATLERIYADFSALQQFSQGLVMGGKSKEIEKILSFLEAKKLKGENVDIRMSIVIEHYKVLVQSAMENLKNEIRKLKKFSDDRRIAEESASMSTTVAFTEEEKKTIRAREQSLVTACYAYLLQLEGMTITDRAALREIQLLKEMLASELGRTFYTHDERGNPL